ncbi:glycosyltransferase [Flavisolibacter nicotianae]|uniref:glycosyltransferase n=1 Tax=Flavisolibacter nicotianae TaxID=2364882 RepID=UPI000EB044ED|nr:glycosyltransferase [Flavisolibacter nicotianae]
MKPTIYIFVDWFWPAYKAGGPVQSLINLCAVLENTERIHIITSAYDLNEKVVLKGVKVNQWNVVKLPGSGKRVNVWYNKGAWKHSSCIAVNGPGIFYFNGIFSFNFFLKPLIRKSWLGGKRQILICPRGMLQTGALSVKPLKKRIFLNVLKISRLVKNVHWHATNEEEEKDIKREFGNNARTIIAPNIPKTPVLQWSYTKKEINKLRLVYISLITEKKGLLEVLDVMTRTNYGISLDIYGPVKDRHYWEKCRKKLNQIREKATYKGDLNPAQVQNTFEKYDASILLTKGENFGHALYESFSAARPVMTSFFTPWTELDQNKAGWNVDISSPGQIIFKLNEISKMNGEEFAPYCEGAIRRASDYYNNLEAPKKYRNLFSMGE